MRMKSHLWAAANVALAAAAGVWAGLDYAFRWQCETSQCANWVTAEIVAVAVTVVTLVLWLLLRHRYWLLLLIGTLALFVPAAIAFGLVELN
jgi:hypothetical protein